MQQGVLYIVSTPIGNLQDITFRAIETLRLVDLIICEDTRVTGKLLHHLGLHKEMVVLNDNNEENVIYRIIAFLQNGQNVALVSDAGTPLISDPGFKLVRELNRKNFKVIPIPGVSSVITALSASSLPADKFLFLGFPPDSLEKKKKFFSSVKTTLECLNKNKLFPTVVFFESPHRIFLCLQALNSVFGDIEIVVAREMTKIHEEFLKIRVLELLKNYEIKNPKGEFVILFRL